MKLPGSKKKKMVTCPRCNAPVPADTPFCEACGARIAPPPSCTLCGTLLEPGSRFCPSCGTMIGSSKDKPPEADVVEKLPADAKKPRAGRAKKTKLPDEDDPGKAPDPLMMIPEPGEQDTPEEPFVPEQESLLKKKVASPASVITIPPSGKRSIFPRGLDARKGAIIAGLLIFIAVIVLVFSGLIPLNQGIYLSGTPAPGSAATETSSPVSAETSAVPETTTAIPVTANESVSLVPGPTQVPPDNLLVYFQAERDPRTKIVSVQYMGGKGQMGVRDVLVRLTRSDGQVLTETFKPLQSGSGVDLQGTEKTDRLEVIVHYYTGDEYTIIDQVFEYKIRNG
ncbi:MAG: zinc-ribbon domain-containing protein [Methanoregula sp.]|nr:zinc-ribbon domain-containing protein [Methanoregula sp.]